MTCITSLFRGNVLVCSVCYCPWEQRNTNYLGSPQAESQGWDSLDDSYPYWLWAVVAEEFSPWVALVCATAVIFTHSLTYNCTRKPHTLFYWRATWLIIGKKYIEVNLFTLMKCGWEAKAWTSLPLRVEFLDCPSSNMESSSNVFICLFSREVRRKDKRTLQQCVCVFMWWFVIFGRWIRLKLKRTLSILLSLCL